MLTFLFVGMALIVGAAVVGGLIAFLPSAALRKLEKNARNLNSRSSNSGRNSRGAASGEASEVQPPNSEGQNE